MKNGRRSLRLLSAVLTAVIVLAQSLSVYADEIVGTVRVNDYLNVRESADEDADVLEVLHNGDRVTITATEGEWYKISGEHEGYVHGDYVVVDSAADTETSAEEPEIEVVYQDTSDDVPEEAEAQPAENGATESGVLPEDVRLMAALVACECGAGDYNGKLAVASVIMNRSRIYGGIKNAIYAPGQFGPASSGKLALTLKTNAIDAVSLKAATDAANGENNIGTAIHFRNVRSGHPGIVAGNHVFW